MPQMSNTRAFVRFQSTELATPYALNVLQGVADIETDKGHVRYVVSQGGNFYAVGRRNAPIVKESRFPILNYDNAARVALSCLATL